jgi:hypothetical protein
MVQRVGGVTLDGSSDESWADKSTNTSGKQSHTIVVGDIIDGSKLTDGDVVYGNLMSDHFPEGSDSGVSTGTYRCITGINIRRTNVKQVVFYLEGETLANFKTWLASNQTQVLYPLATPQTIDLGTIDMPQVQDGDTIEVIAAVTPSIDATWWATGWSGRGGRIRQSVLRNRGQGRVNHLHRWPAPTQRQRRFRQYRRR